MSFQLPTNVQIDDQHIWCQLFESAKRFQGPRPALFLDRDGVIVEEVHYLHKVEDVALIDGAAEIIAQANALDIPVIVVTNQSGIARDMFGWVEFAAVQQRMLELLAQPNGAFVDAVYACPYHKIGKPPYQAENHEARKPNPGMLTRAMANMTLVKDKSWIVGDKASDLRAGKAAGLKGGIHVLSGHGSDNGEVDKSRKLNDSTFVVHVEKTIGNVGFVFK